MVERNKSLNICCAVSAQSRFTNIAQCSNALCVAIQTLRLSSGCLLFVNVSYQDLYLQTVWLTVCAKEKAQMCVNSQGL